MTDHFVLGEPQLGELRRLATREQRSVEQLVVQAVDDFLAKRRDESGDACLSGFGLWGEGEDGLAYQERLRSEW